MSDLRKVLLHSAVVIVAVGYLSLLVGAGVLAPLILIGTWLFMWVAVMIYAAFVELPVRTHLKNTSASG